jgi:hypothetical protein
MVTELKAILYDHLDLIRDDQRETEHPLSGMCYIAAEALYHLDGGNTKYFIEVVKLPSGITHWFLRKRNDYSIVDITVEQFYDNPPDYSTAKRLTFLTKKPSKRAQVLIDDYHNRYGSDDKKDVSFW